MPDLAIRTNFEFAVEETERLWIPVRNSVVLAARLWRPKTDDPVPVILEMNPYRTRDLYRRVDDMNARYWAGHGYAVIRLDILGSGDSGLELPDEYTGLEIEQGADAIDWATTQPWCSGAVGLTGLSWSGFTALRIATRHPEAVQALVVTAASDDGFVTDIHHLGGVPYVARVSWAGTMLLLNGLPPDPDSFPDDTKGPSDRWFTAWQERLKANRSWLVEWLNHQTRDQYWQDKAVFGPNRTASTPLLVLGGLADKYKTSTLRLLAQWQGPARGILGPWEHIYPQLAGRQPAIGYLQEALRWWDYWLKGRDTQVLDDPDLRLWLGRGDDGPGGWVGVPAWPAEALPNRRFAGVGIDGLITADATSLEPSQEDSPQIILSAQPRPVTARPGEDPYDDAPRPCDLEAMAESGAHLMTSPPLKVDLPILSVPVLRATVTPQGEHGAFAAWLIDLAPDGSAHLVSRGALNLAFAHGFEAAAPVTPGEAQTITVTLDAAAWTVPAGHRIVLALAAQAWPILWPSRSGPDFARADLAVAPTSVVLDLPFLPDTVPVKDFAPPEIAVPDPVTELKWLRPDAITLPAPDEGTQISTPTTFTSGHYTATGTDVHVHGRSDLALMANGQPSVQAQWQGLFYRPGWSIDVTASTSLVSTPETFEIAWTITARWNGETVHTVEETDSVPRKAY